MKVFKRAQISVIRKPGKFFILFTVMLLLGIMVSGSVSTSLAIVHTENRLLGSIPPLVTLAGDGEAFDEYLEIYGEWPEVEEISSDLLESIGSLPYIRAFDYAVYGNFFSTSLSFSTDISLYSEVDWLVEEVALENLNFHSYRSEGYDFEQFLVKGVRNSNIIDLEEGVIYLESGRIFTPEEIESGSYVALLPRALADVNHLEVGSTFILEMRVYDTHSFDGSFSGYFEYDAVLIASEEIEIEVVGIFTPTVVMDREALTIDLANHIELNRRIYTPISVARLPQEMRLEHVQAFYPEEVRYHDSFEYRDILFALYDPLDLETFNQAALELLPEFWITSDLTYEFASISYSMLGLQSIVNGIVIGASLAALLVLGFLILLFLYDRKSEIGIYLALGESRIKIITQILVEIISVSVIAMIFALFIGYQISNQMTYQMLRQELVESQNIFPNQDRTGSDFNSMGFGIQMTGEEMLEAYSVSLDGTTVVTFFISAMGMIFISTVIPIIYLTRMNPRGLLLEGTIG